MEFPGIGANCAERSCKKLDFLPMRCDACSQVFCCDHIQYSTHNCPESYRKDNQLPVCPLCNTAVSVRKGESADMVISNHIDQNCQSDPARERRKIYTNKCSAKGCKQKELVPVHCDTCQQNFCLKHRHEQDHDCEGFRNAGRAMSKQGIAAMSRHQTSKKKLPSSSSGQPQMTALAGIGKDLDRERRERQVQHGSAQNYNTASFSHGDSSTTQTIQDRLSEDEDLALALQLSLACHTPPPVSQANKRLTEQEQDDFQLAKAIAASENESLQRQSPPTNPKIKCTIS